MWLKFCKFVGVVVACATPLHGHGALGNGAFVAGTSAQVDARVASYRPMQIAQGYGVSVVELNNNTVVQEFLDPRGRVFAVRWSGPDLPDMGMLLGPYMPLFKAAVQAGRHSGKRGGPVVVQSDGLFMVSTGVMGAFQGYAYLEALVPPGVNIQTLLK